MPELGWKKDKLVEMANYWINHACYMDKVPELKEKTARIMGLEGVKGLKTIREKSSNINNKNKKNNNNKKWRRI